MHVGIIGGGMMGLATAFYLNKKGIKVTILEKEGEIGGLSRSQEIIPGLYWDRFYHVILSTDKELLKFIDEIGLAHDVQFTETKTGFYTNGQLYSMSNTMEFLRFKPLSLIDKLRLGLGILYASKLKNWKRLEKIYVKSWLTRVFGRRNYEKMWEPLLRSKLGSAKNEASAALIWAIIKRYYGTRHSSSKTELMGCVKGGYYAILHHVSEYLQKNGNTILVGHGVEEIRSSNGGGTRVQCQNGKSLRFDRLIATTPNPTIVKMWPDMPSDVRSNLESVRYLSILCATLVIKRSLTPFYITNLTDMNLPFSGLIESSHVIPSSFLNGNALLYLPRYLPAGDPFYEETDEYVLENFIEALSGMFRDFSKNDIIAQRVNRETFVQPIQEVGYSEKILPMKTPLENFYFVNTTMILNSTLNNNQVIRLAQKAADVVTDVH